MCDVCVSVCISVFVYIYDSWSNTFIYATRVLDQTILCCRCFQSWIRFYKAGSILITDTTIKCWLGNIIPVLKGDIASSESPESGATTTHLTSLVVPTSVDTSTTLENIGARYVLSRSINKLIYVLLKLSVPL